jgi:hypothetical protein
VKVWPAIVAVPLRDSLVFVATSNCTLPLPVPLAPDDTRIHASLLCAIHVQSGAVAIEAVTVCPAMPTSLVAGEIVYVQPLACSTVNVRPAAVIVPARGGPWFAPTEYATLAGPLPLAPDEIAIQSALLRTFHAQPFPATTLNDLFPPEAEID